MSPREMYKMLRDAQADIMLSGGRSQFIALKAKMPWLDINQERHHAYMGYVGMVELVKEIDKAVYNPVWEQVRKRAPWEEQTWEEVADAAIAAEAAALAADPVLAREKRRSATVCNCKSVSRAVIEDAIIDGGLTTATMVSEKTLAGTGCGSCVDKLGKIVKTRDEWNQPIPSPAQHAA